MASAAEQLPGIERSLSLFASLVIVFCSSAWALSDKQPLVAVDPKEPPILNPCGGQCYWTLEKQPPVESRTNVFVGDVGPAPGFSFLGHQAGPGGDLLDIEICGDLWTTNIIAPPCDTIPGTMPSWNTNAQTEGCQEFGIVFDIANAATNCPPQCAGKTLTIVGITEVSVTASANGPCPVSDKLNDPFASAQGGALMQLIGSYGPIGTVVDGTSYARTYANAIHNPNLPPGGPTPQTETRHYAGKDPLAPLLQTSSAAWSGSFPFLVLIVTPCTNDSLWAQIETLSSARVVLHSQGTASASSHVAILDVAFQVSCCECSELGNPELGVYP